MIAVFILPEVLATPTTHTMQAMNLKNRIPSTPANLTMETVFVLMVKEITD